MSISQFLVHALVEIRVLRSRAVSASRSHQLQGYKPCQYPNSSCTHSLKSVSCGVELSPHRGRTNIKDTNRINIPFLVHAIVEIRVLRSRAVSASRSHQLQGSQCLTTASVPALSLKKSCTQSLKSMCLRSRIVSASNHQFQGSKPRQYPKFRDEFKAKGTTALRGASSPAAAFWPMSGPSQKQRESHESSSTSCSGQVCTR